VAGPGTFDVRTSAVIMTADWLDQAPGAPFTLIPNLPDQVLAYLLPSRYCEAECFNDMTSRVVIGRTPGYDQVAAIVDWVRHHIAYRPGCSMVPLAATDVNTNGQGVCRDLAHIAIAMCRSISVPARMVVGYRYDLVPMDLHAWFEAWVGGRWYTFDPTQPRLTGGYVAVGFGRDAADVAIYTQFGPAVFPSSQRVSVELLENQPD
jgi:transglutaminase-like putative cysteine protease